jgi:hypothetical protein
MPTIRAEFPVTLKFNIEISRDFYLNAEFQLAQALYRHLIELDERDGIDYLLEAIAEIGEGKPVVQKGGL